MRPYQIMSDTDSDLPESYRKEKGIILVPQYTILEGKTYEGAEGIDPHEFYKKMSEGAQPTSQAINPAVCEEKFRAVLEQGKDIIYLSFPLAMSGSYNTAVMVGKNLQEEYPDAKIYVLDTLSASLGQTLLIMKAVDMQEAGSSLEEVVEWIENNKIHNIVNFTVNDLHHLQRGGRVSKSTAVIGSLIKIKPMMYVTDEGKLEACGTVRGRKKALATLVDRMAEQMTEKWLPVNDRVAIAHGDCVEDAKHVADMIRERFGITEFVINDINPSIGVHSGPGTILLSFFGESRK